MKKLTQQERNRRISEGLRLAWKRRKQVANLKGFYKSDMASVDILRADGTSETHGVGRRILSDWISRMIGARTWDTVNLRDGRVMIVDDTGAVDGKPVNRQATELYRSVCQPGTTWEICGDVAITLDENFA